ncbi:hypothetical protein SAMN05421856_102230 [Chryseobacterium taichungense]|uniref:Uncharacterized protein n=1 Tax=Chryseobacterium taichungense TaxID=295069 RepID=A0A1H7X5N3_9FLAO|nr:hypothetical protein [Chryseobacterium taichungense]SEM29172.1 hypothetical protein SAMN05421856_102230 [Chryseobacterium taichungense]
MNKTIQKGNLILANKYLAKVEKIHANGLSVNYVRKDLELSKFILLNECEKVPISYVALEELGFKRVSTTIHNLTYIDHNQVFIIDDDMTFTLIYKEKSFHDIRSITDLQNVYFEVTGKELTLKENQY